MNSFLGVCQHASMAVFHNTDLWESSASCNTYITLSDGTLLLVADWLLDFSKPNITHPLFIFSVSSQAQGQRDWMFIHKWLSTVQSTHPGHYQVNPELQPEKLKQLPCLLSNIHEGSKGPVDHTPFLFVLPPKIFYFHPVKLHNFSNTSFDKYTTT